MKTLLRNDSDRQAAIRYLESLKFHGDRKYRLSVTVWRPVRSLASNRLYWLWLGVIAKDTGNDVDDLHSYCKQTFLPQRPLTIGDVTVTMTGSTAKLDSGEFTRYLDRVQAWASVELGIVLPSPGELGWNEMLLEHGGE